MKMLNRVIDGPTVVSRVLLFSIIWWALTDGTAGSWWIGVPAVACTSIVSVALVPPVGLVWREVMGFVPFFLWHSLKGGADVAWRAFHPRMPITPELIEYPLRLPPGLPRVILVNTVSLLPGTLSAELVGQVLRVHVLDSLGDFLAELEALEKRVRRMWRRTTDDFPRR
ncbi:MAG: Na+/H+ antiporter subunit E [Gammaproteobacteria bacterium]|jgi:multicomponent Na+:H+ antiporter subunit E